MSKDERNVIRAFQLSGEHIDHIIRFSQHDADRDIVVVVETELRQIYHVGGSTTVNVGLGAEVEYNLDANDAILLDPPDSLSKIW